MRPESKNVITFYQIVRSKNRCLIFAYFSTAFSFLGGIFIKASDNYNVSLKSFVLLFCLFTIISVVWCIVLDIIRNNAIKHTLLLEKENESTDFYKNMFDIKFIHDEVALYLAKMEMQQFDKTEDSRYRMMWKVYFEDWFMAENDKIYRYRENPKNEFDEYAIKKHINELGILQQKMLCLFGRDDELSEIIEVHFKSLRKDFYNLIILKN